MKNKLLTFIVLTFIFSNACRKDLKLEVEKMVYETTFDKPYPLKETGLSIEYYQANAVAGYYNQSGFTMQFDQLSKHNYLKITFDLYIHDTWDGNSIGNSEVSSGPDLWTMQVDGKEIIKTTFSNSTCNTVYCLQQSYPRNYPFQNDSFTSATKTKLPSLCTQGSITTLYHIEKLIKHDNSSVTINFQDQLKQSNVLSRVCDESWSMDNFRIFTLEAN